jgi:uncharacterized protein (DUF4415 family)
LQGTGPFLSCEEAIAPALASLMRRAMLAGWTEEEIRVAIVALADCQPDEGGEKDGVFGTVGITASTNCISGRGAPPAFEPDELDELDVAYWNEEDHATARLLEDVFAPDVIRGILAKRRQKQTVTIRLDMELIEAFTAEGGDWHARINDMLRAARKAAERGV